METSLQPDLIPTLGHASGQWESALSGWAKMRRMRPRSTDPVENSQRDGAAPSRVIRSPGIGRDRTKSLPNCHLGGRCCHATQPCSIQAMDPITVRRRPDINHGPSERSWLSVAVCRVGRQVG